jgi:hypothetical protein
MLQNVDFNQIYSNFTTSPVGDVKAGNIELTIAQTLNMFAGINIVGEDIIANALGLYNISTNVRSGRVMWGKFGEINYVTTKRPTGCTRDPKRGLLLNTDEAPLHPRHVFVEVCNDAFVNKCWRQLQGVGNDINDVMKSELGRVMMYMIIKSMNRGIGRDLIKSQYFGEMPIIKDALDANTTMTEQRKEEILKTLSGVSGVLTNADLLGEVKGMPNLAGEIDDDMVDGAKFVGSAMELIDSLDEMKVRAFEEAADGLEYLDQREICLVTPGIFNKLEQEIKVIHKDIPAVFRYIMTGKFYEEFAPELNNLVHPGVLCYGNKLVVRRNDWGFFAKECGFLHHRAVLTVQKNIGIGFDIVPSETTAGMGMVIQKCADLDKGGKYQMETNYEHGTMIIDPDFMVQKVWKDVA